MPQRTWSSRSALAATCASVGVCSSGHTADGTRKYLTAGERDAFLREADQADRPVRTLCVTLALRRRGFPERHPAQRLRRGGRHVKRDELPIPAMLRFGHPNYARIDQITD
jgi:hypothetical protein